MSYVAVSVENLSKLYRLGLKDEMPDTLAATLFSWVRAPHKNLKRLRSLTRFDPNEESEDVLYALRNASFQVKRGEVLGIIGRNGAGKSTLLKILSRIVAPTTGRVVVRGRVGSLLEVGTGFHPELTGRENTYMNGTILGMSKREIDRKFDEIVEFSGVEKFLDTPVKRYSSGMMVRLAFAVAAHLDPEILIVDEVLAVGDHVFQQKCIGKMSEVASGGKTVLFVSHNLPAVGKLCSRGIVLDRGVITFDAPIRPAIEHYGTSVSRGIPIAASGPRAPAPRGVPHIEAVRVTDRTGATKGVFRHDEFIALHAVVSGVSTTFCFTFLVKDLLGDCVYHLRSQDYGFLLQPSGEKTEFSAALPRLGLKEGEYAVVAWMGDALDHELDSWNECLSFTVVNSGHSTERLNSHVLPIVEWKRETRELVAV